MATTALYVFSSGDMADTSGNSRNGSLVGAGPNFLSVGPGPLVGTKFIQGCTDSNYATLPTSVYTGITTTGTIKLSMFGIQNNTVSISSDHGANGNFFLLGGTSAFTVRYPKSGGHTQVATANHGITNGKWFTVFIHWTTGHFKIDVLNTQTGVLTNILDSLFNADFSSCSSVFVGRDTLAGGFSTTTAMDNIEFLTTDTTTDTQTYTRQKFLASVGHSYVQGTTGTAGSCGSPAGDGYRLSFQSYIDSIARGINYLLVGQTTQGTIRTPYTDGVAGSKIADLDGIITARLTSDFPALIASNDYVVLLGPIEYNDAAAVTNVTTYTNSYKSVIDKITAYSSSIKILVITNPSTPNATDVATYVTATKDAYANRLAAGANIYLADWAAQPTFAWCNDNIHPSNPTAGYELMGNYIAKQTVALLDPTSPTALSGFYLNN